MGFFLIIMLLASLAPQGFALALPGVGRNTPASVPTVPISLFQDTASPLNRSGIIRPFVPDTTRPRPQDDSRPQYENLTKRGLIKSTRPDPTFPIQPTENSIHHKRNGINSSGPKPDPIIPYQPKENCIHAKQSVKSARPLTGPTVPIAPKDGSIYKRAVKSAGPPKSINRPLQPKKNTVNQLAKRAVRPTGPPVSVTRPLQPKENSINLLAKRAVKSSGPLTSVNRPLQPKENTVSQLSKRSVGPTGAPVSVTRPLQPTENSVNQLVKRNSVKTHGVVPDPTFPIVPKDGSKYKRKRAVKTASYLTSPTIPRQIDENHISKRGINSALRPDTTVPKSDEEETKW